MSTTRARVSPTHQESFEVLTDDEDIGNGKFSAALYPSNTPAGAVSMSARSVALSCCYWLSVTGCIADSLLLAYSTVYYGVYCFRCGQIAKCCCCCRVLCSEKDKAYCVVLQYIQLLSLSSIVVIGSVRDLLWWHLLPSYNRFTTCDSLQARV